VSASFPCTHPRSLAPAWYYSNQSGCITRQCTRLFSPTMRRLLTHHILFFGPSSSDPRRRGRLRAIFGGGPDKTAVRADSNHDSPMVTQHLTGLGRHSNLAGLVRLMYMSGVNRAGCPHLGGQLAAVGRCHAINSNHEAIHEASCASINTDARASLSGGG
jgi:hypothetical protein